MSEPKCVGTISTDVAAIMIGDPAKMLADRGSVPMEYDEFVDANSDDPVFAVGSAFVAKTGSDGFFKVFHDIENNRLIIELEPSRDVPSE